MDYFRPSLRVDCIALAEQYSGCRSERARFDLITELEVTTEGDRYLLVGVDCFSKWVVIWLLQTKSSKEIGGWFFRHFLPRYGKTAVGPRGRG